MKKLHRFLISNIDNSKDWVITDEKLVHQIGHVLKMKTGEKFVVFADGGDDTVVEIKDRDKKNIFVETVSKTEVLQPKINLIAVVSIVKGGAFELIVQKLTELGVSAIVPLLSDRTVKQSIRLERVQSISDEALEQSGGTRRVKIYEPIDLAECFEKFKFPSVVFEIGAGNLEKENNEQLVMYIGPEGGWSEKDLELFKKNNVSFVGLGSRVLRADTAAIVGAFTLLQ